MVSRKISMHVAPVENCSECAPLQVNTRNRVRRRELKVDAPCNGVGFISCGFIRWEIRLYLPFGDGPSIASSKKEV